MKISDTELANMVTQACTVVLEVKEPAGYLSWWSYQYLFSMITAISAVFKIDIEADALKAITDTTNNIGMPKNRAALRLLMILNPGQIALFNGFIFKETAKIRTQALGCAYIEVCKAVKLMGFR